MKYLICDVENITTPNAEAPNGCYYPGADKTKHARFQTFPPSFRSVCNCICGEDGEYQAIFCCDDGETIPNGYTEITEAQVEAYKKQWDIGKRTLLDLLDSEAEFINASRELVHSRFQLEFAKYRLLNGVGNLVPAMGLDYPEEVKLPTTLIATTSNISAYEAD